MIIIKPLYGIPESNIYWFATYNKYYIKELLITISPYDLYLFINTIKRLFVILIIQTNNTLFLANK
jgi:tRNA(Ile)-lysidine synthase TilS/MesJ